MLSDRFSRICCSSAGVSSTPRTSRRVRKTRSFSRSKRFWRRSSAATVPADAPLGVFRMSVSTRRVSSPSVVRTPWITCSARSIRPARAPVDGSAYPASVRAISSRSVWIWLRSRTVMALETARSVIIMSARA